jgi:transcriptional regulator with XRE-family HTH domain
MENEVPITAKQARSARSLLKWSQQDLAQRAGVAVSTIADFERGQRTPIQNNATAIQQAFEKAGVTFVPGGAVIGMEIKWLFMAEASAWELHIRYTAHDAPIIRGFAAIFGTLSEERATISRIQAATPALKDRLDAFVIQHAHAVPQLQKLKKFILSLKDDEFFLLLPEEPASSIETLEYERLLIRLNNPDVQSHDDEMQVTFGPLLQRYNLTLPRTDRPALIGTKLREQRKCRFCDGTVANGATFDNDAHAIPTALGNHHLKLADECDVCNSHFGEKVEPALIQMLNIQRVFLGIHGRGKNNGRPELHYHADRVYHDGQQMIIKSSNISEDAAGVLSVRLGKGIQIVPVACYRALVKVAISVMPSDQLPTLRRTICWLRHGEHQGESLPRVATAVVPLPPNPSAQISVYIRKEPVSKLPHVVAEFRLGCYMYVYVLPFSDGDSWDLVGFFDDPEFKDTFRHYAQVPLWTHQDLSSDDKVTLLPNIRVAPRVQAASA